MKTLQIIKDTHCNYVLSIYEELRLNGFDVKINSNWEIEMDTIAGKITMFPDDTSTVMAEYYRFISHYGSRLNLWGLQNKINEQINHPARRDKNKTYGKKRNEKRL